MALLDTVQDVFRKVLPPKEGRIPASNSGIGNGGHSMFTDEDVSLMISYVYLDGNGESGVRFGQPRLYVTHRSSPSCFFGLSLLLLGGAAIAV